MNDAGLVSQHTLRGIQLMNLGRFADAEKAFREALSENVHDAVALHQLAACLYQQPNRLISALSTIRSAIAVEPAEAGHFALEALILCRLRRGKDALAAGQMALQLDPNSGFALTALTQVYLDQQEWAEAERTARQALTLDPEHAFAANQLAHALRMQNKLDENAGQIAGMLARDPENALTHVNAGWSALQRGQRRDAETHFREALRLDPELDNAREGLLSSFRARSRFYRGYLRYCFFMQRLKSRARWAVVIGLYLAMRLANQVFTGPYRFLGIGLGVVYFAFVMWVWIAKGVGNFILLFDGFARHALRQGEKIEAMAVGGCVACGIPLLIGGLVLGFGLGGGEHSDAAAAKQAAKYADEAFLPLVTGVGLIAAAFPLALTFTNPSRVGSRLFGAIGAAILLCTLLLVVNEFAHLMSNKVSAGIFTVTLVACALSTWLGNVPALRRQ